MLEKCKYRINGVDCVFKGFLPGSVQNCKYPNKALEECPLLMLKESGQEVPDQNAKADYGKPKLTLVPRQIIKDVARVREYGNKKYGDPDNWKTVEVERYRDAAFRHFLAYLDNPVEVDNESGLPHLWHLACNIAFLCEMEKGLFKT